MVFVYFVVVAEYYYKNPADIVDGVLSIDENNTQIKCNEMKCTCNDKLTMRLNIYAAYRSIESHTHNKQTNRTNVPTDEK